MESGWRSLTEPKGGLSWLYPRLFGRYSIFSQHFDEGIPRITTLRDIPRSSFLVASWGNEAVSLPSGYKHILWRKTPDVRSIMDKMAQTVVIFFTYWAPFVQHSARTAVSASANCPVPLQAAEVKRSA